MNIFKTLFTLLLLISSIASAQQEIVGEWKTIDDTTGKPKSIVEIYKEGDKFYGKIKRILKKSITEILYDQGYILKYKFNETANKQGSIMIALKYDRETKKPVIQKLKRVSRPGLRHYVKSTELPSVINGLGTAVISTSKGVVTDKTARKENVGGEVLFYIY